MLNLALVGLMAGSLAMSPTDDGKLGTSAPKADEAPVAAAAGPSIFTEAADDAAAHPIHDHFAFGRSFARSPLRLWASYGIGEAEDRYNTNGSVEEITIANTDGDIQAQRVIAGAEIGLPVALFGFGLSAGAQIQMAKNTFQVGTSRNPNPLLANNIESTFGLQAAKFYGELRTNTIGIHAGYHMDLGAAQTFADPNPALGGAQLPTGFPNSDRRNAVFYGASFDYPTRMLRLFGSVDYFDVNSPKDNPNTPNFDERTLGDRNDLMSAMFGTGLRLNILEIGAALQIQTRLNGPVTEGIGEPRIGGSLATIHPYLRLSPPRLPVSLFVKGGVHQEYTDSGYPIGGSNAVKPSIGFTAGLAFGFR
jgi:hypothetical protein